jgi:methionyl-tRNA synthetase
MRHLITAGLPYINGVKHLGNLVGSMLPADVYARFLRQRGEEVLYVCGTDEHGAPAEIAAEQRGQDVREFCDEQFEVQHAIYERFALSFDHFGRTSRAPNHELTTEVFQGLHANGYTDTRKLKQVYSIDDERFLADRYIVGTCPHCGNDSARGDQCENCTKLLDPTDLIDPRSALSGSRNLEVREREHIFLKLPALADRIGPWVEDKKNWPDLSRQIAGKWLKDGLQDRCITRELKWGVPVPLEGFGHMVFYVWFDAPIGYIAATREWADARGTPDAWKDWWVNAGEDVKYTQFMGKDNLPFHTVMFPGMLMGSDPKWKLADQIKGFHWLNYYGGKFSTSAGRGVFTDAALELYPADYWRYALMARVPETSDATFTWEEFQGIVNKDLADVLGNFVNRVLKFTRSKFGDEIPAGGTPGPAETKLQVELTDAINAFTASFGQLEFRKGMQELRRLWTIGNTYINDREPWRGIKVDRDDAAMVIRTCFNLIHLFASTAMPVIPHIATEMLSAVGLTAEDAGVPETLLGLDTLKAGRPFTVIPPLVSKIADEDVALHEERFGQ